MPPRALTFEARFALQQFYDLFGQLLQIDRRRGLIGCRTWRVDFGQIILWHDLFRPTQPPIDTGDFLHPLLPFGMFQIENVVQRPVEVISQIGYLLAQAIKGVAYDPPNSVRSTS